MITKQDIDPNNSVFLIDGSSFLYRAYYGMRPLHTAQGVPVQAVYSFCRMMKKLIDTFGIKRALLVWDSKGKTERHEIFPDYKATRQAPPSDLFDQKEYIIKFAQLIGLKQVSQPGVEADDLINSLARDFVQEGARVVIVSSDKDLHQLLSSQIVLFDEFKDELIDQASAEEKRGFAVAKIPFYFALVGDTSDNIPGVAGIGPKGATDLVNTFASLDDLYSNLGSVTRERTRQLLIAGEKNARLSLDLFLLRYHATGLVLADADFDAARWAHARPLFQELEFKSLLKELGSAAHDTQAQVIPQITGYNFELVLTQKKLEHVCAQIRTAGICALDTETSGLNPLQADIIGISICVQEGTAYYIPLGHRIGSQQLSILDTQVATRDSRQLSLDTVRPVIGPVLADHAVKKILHNAKFDQLVLHNAGFILNGVFFDTMIAASLVRQEWQRINLKALSEFYCNEKMLAYVDIVKKNKASDFSYVPLEDALEYAAADAHQTLKLYYILRDLLEKEGMQELFYDIEMPLSQVLYAMELRGIFLDTKMLADLDKQVSRDLRAIEQEISDLTCTDGTVNLNSSQQVADLLFNQLNLPPQKKLSKSGGYSTDQEVLEVLAQMHVVPALILKYRELYKLKSTYIDALPTFVNQHDSRVHTTFSQTIAATGRLTSSEPNLQNIPADGSASGYGIKIREAFKPVNNQIFVSADYSQVELRVLAHITQDPALLEAFQQGIDIHTRTASKLFDVELTQVTNEQRQIGKRINFSILYGLTPFGLSKDLGISLKEAKEYIDKFFEQYPQVSVWMEEVVAFAKRHGYVKTLWGRRRYIAGIHEKNKNLYELAKRVAINTVIQGTAADIMKIGMINLERLFAKQQTKAQIVLQIHDELLIECPRVEVQAIERMAREILESVVNWSVPLEVSTSIGSDWATVT